MTTRRDARTEAVLQHSKDLQRKLQEMADELDRYVQALQTEVERLHESGGSGGQPGG